MTQTTVNQRINFLIDHYEGGNKSAFGRRVDMKSGVIGDLVGGRLNKPSFEAILKILAAYPLVNTEWFLKGEGEIFRFSEDEEDERVLGSTPHLAKKITARDENEYHEYHEYGEVIERPDPPNNLFSRLSSISEAAYSSMYNTLKSQKLIRETYELITPEIFKAAVKGKNVHMYILHWNFSPNAGKAWSIIRSMQIGLYPQYPALNYFLDFADPYRRIAVFVEERIPSSVMYVDYQDKALALYGWKVFRIPNEVSNSYESDLLPIHLVNIDDVNAKSEEQLIERKKWNQELSKKTIDGFFRWLKDNYFKNEIVVNDEGLKSGTKN